MHAPKLTLVLVEGQIDASPFARRDLRIEAYKGENFPASTRALLFVANDLMDDTNRAGLVRWARRRVQSALDYGIGCVIAVPPGQEHIASQTIAGIGERAATIIRADPEIAAQACLRLQPGPLPNLTLVIKGIETPDPETVLLLQRAFRDFDKIVLDPLTGGRSAITGIWRVDAQSEDAELRSPFVAKCGPLKSIDQQLNTYRDVVEDRVPYRGCAPICLDRSVAGSSKRLSVSRFVERAKRLDEVLIDPDCPDVAGLMNKIYSGPLHRWRAAIERRTVKHVWQFLPRNVTARFGPGLNRTRRKLLREGTNVATPSELIKRLASLPSAVVPLCRAHDDLNFRNVFVGEGGNEIILIDFTRAVKRPLAQDVARLDVGLAFDDELNGKQPLDDQILLDYFSDDLFSISLRHAVDGRNARARLKAIEALRRNILTEADQHGYDPRQEYKVAITSGLLYEAKRQTQWSGIAYRCANALSLSL